MYLSELRIWNFRKYGLKGGDKIENAQPSLEVKFKKGVNVLVGENDSGKIAIIDAIRYVLKTQRTTFSISLSSITEVLSVSGSNQLRPIC